MRKRQKEAILISYFKAKEKYEKLAEYMIHFFRDDPSSPKESLHTIIYRIKDNLRLIEKIDEENKHCGVEQEVITYKNFQARVGDILGIRLVCLRLADIKTVEGYLGLLAEEKILRFIREPDYKRSFILPVDPGESIPEGLDLRYSGYSSIHYQVELGANSDAADELKGLQIEIQLRTILEEAWGEIDHKYRYVHSRSGDEVPEYIHTGFYNLSAYLQVAALQAEHLCRQAEAHRLSITRKSPSKPVATVASGYRPPTEYGSGSDQAATPSELQAVLEDALGFKLTVRTLTYILKRLDDFGYAERPQAQVRAIFSASKLQEFRTIYREIIDREPFEDDLTRNIDAINALNFGLFHLIHGKRVAQEGLRSVLRWRRARSRT